LSERVKTANARYGQIKQKDVGAALTDELASLSTVARCANDRIAASRFKHGPEGVAGQDMGVHDDDAQPGRVQGSLQQQRTPVRMAEFTGADKLSLNAA
jgi:hypothetical protein